MTNYLQNDFKYYYNEKLYLFTVVVRSIANHMRQVI